MFYSPATVSLQFNEQMISPKHFVHLAGKSTLKDWKRAIRLEGVMLRWAPPNFPLQNGTVGCIIVLLQPLNSKVSKNLWLQ